MDSVQGGFGQSIADKTYIYDFGQNLSGVASLTLTGEAGQTVKLRFAEMLNDASGTGDGREGRCTRRTCALPRIRMCIFSAGCRGGDMVSDADIPGIPLR